MENGGRLYTQVAALAGVPPEKALAACYLLQLSRAGKSMDQACALSRMERGAVRDVARDWGFSFPDYTPAAPVMFVWHKTKRGEWELRDGAGKAVGSMLSDGEGGYCAAVDKSLRFEGSKPDVAARRLSKELDRRARETFGVDDIAIMFTHPDGEQEQLAPEVPQNLLKMRDALAA